MDTFRDLIDEFGGTAKYAAACGVSIDAANKQYQRNRINVSYWPQIVARAPRAGVQGITVELLLSLRGGTESVNARFRSRPKNQEVSA